MAETYNTVKTDTIVQDEEERDFLRGLAGCVCLTPAEEERILPSRRPGDPGVPPPEATTVMLDEYDLTLADPDDDDLDPTDDDLSDAELVHDFLTE